MSPKNLESRDALVPIPDATHKEDLSKILSLEDPPIDVESKSQQPKVMDGMHAIAYLSWSNWSY